MLSPTGPRMAVFRSRLTSGKAAMVTRFFIIALVAVWGGVIAFGTMPARGEANNPAPLATETTDFFQAHCVKCHQGERPKGKLDLTKLQTVQSLTADAKRWSRIIKRIEAGEMPPVGSEPLPTEPREKFLAEVKRALHAAICEAGPQPGPSPCTACD